MQIVKDAASRAILDNMGVQELREHFEEKAHQKQTICCTIKELIANNAPGSNCYLRQDIVNFLYEVLTAFDSEGKYYNSLDLRQN